MLKKSLKECRKSYIQKNESVQLGTKQTVEMYIKKRQTNIIVNLCQISELANTHIFESFDCFSYILVLISSFCL